MKKPDQTTANSGGITLTAATANDAVQINGALTAAGQTVTLATNNGAIGEGVASGPVGTITAGTLNANAGAAAITLPNANVVAAVDNLQGAGVTFTDAASTLTLDVRGGPMGAAISAGTGQLTSSNGGDVVVASGTQLSGTAPGAGSPGVSIASTDGGVTFQGPVSLSGDTSVAATTTIGFDSTVDGGYNLTSGTANGAVTTFGGAVGGTTNLASVTTGAAVLDADITTTGAISLGAVTLAPTAASNLVTLTAGVAVSVGSVDSDAVKARAL